MRFVFRSFLALVLLLVVGAVAVVYLGLEDEPVVARAAPLGGVQVERARRLLARHDPRRLRHGDERTVALSEEELTLLLDYLMSRAGGGAARVRVTRQGIALTASLALPRNPVGRYVNVTTALQGRDPGLPRVTGLRIGRVPVPGIVADALVRGGIALLDENDGIRVAAQAVREVRADAGTLRVSYRWDARIPDAVRERLLPPDERERLRVYQSRLAGITMDPATRGPVSLASLLGGLLALAAKRSATGDPVAENRAAILVLSLYANGRGLERLAPEAREWPRARAHRVHLRGRRDFAQHFIVSAAIAALGEGGIADVVGLYKEVDDARGGSGFSFRDLAADRAGTRFGGIATASPDSARALQRLAAPGLDDAAVMPEVGDLAEGLQESEFRSRFGEIGSPAYRRVAAEIEQRISAIELYRLYP